MSDVISGLVAGLPSLIKAASDLTKASGESERNKQLIEFQQLVIQFQSQIASIQAENHTLQQRNRDLEGELSKIGTWAGEIARYQLVTHYNNTIYALREANAQGEPPHWLCANCAQSRKKSILNTQSKEGWIYIACPNCKTSFPTGMRGIAAPKYADDLAS